MHFLFCIIFLCIDVREGTRITVWWQHSLQRYLLIWCL